MSYVGKVTDYGGTTHLVGSTLYGTCSTQGSTAAKVVVCSDFNKLITGVTIHVKFSLPNTAASPTLNVNSTGAKPIYKCSSTPAASTDITWPPDAIVSFTYDGTNWVMNDAKDNEVLQSLNNTSGDHRVLFSISANDTSETAGVGKNGNLLYNPSEGFILPLRGITLGQRTTNSNIGSHSFAQGEDITASAISCHAEGYGTTAKGFYSHAEGYYTIASRRCHHVFGEYNIEDAPDVGTNYRGTYAEIVGNGTDDDARSNARTLDWSGNQWIAGNYSDTNGLLAMKEVTQAQYDALTTAEKNNGTAYFITDRLSPAATDLWTKVGTATLSTTAQDCSGAINELDSNITKARESVEFMNSNNINNTTATAFNLNGKLSDYQYICIHLRNYNNILQTQYMYSSYFRLTGSGTRPMFYVHTDKYIGCIEVYYKSDTSVYIKASSGNTFTSNYRIAIYGYTRYKSK